MRLTAMTSRNAIRLAHAAFRRQLRTGVKEKRKIGNRAGADEVTIYVHKGLGFWVFLGAGADMDQSWNPFGDLGGAYRDPQATLPMQCQINFPHEGINRRVGGVFARDRNGRVYVTHSGKLGGGRMNIGKSGFIDFLAGQHPGIDWADIDWGAGPPSRHIIVGDVESARFRAGVGRFVQTCAEYKRLAVAGTSRADPPGVQIERTAPVEQRPDAREEARRRLHPRPSPTANADVSSALYTFFLRRFTDKDLLRFVKHELRAPQIAAAVSAHGSLADISSDVAERLAREGFIDEDLFSALRRRFPRLHREIAPIEQQLRPFTRE